MGTIDLGPPPPVPEDLLDGLPRRVALTLPELQLVARRAGDAPLPFELDDEVATGRGDAGRAGLQGRLGLGPREGDRAAYAEAMAALHNPAASLSRRGLLVGGPHDGVIDPGLVGAVGLLATPRVALDLDVVAESTQVRCWHRQAGGAVAVLSTHDGLVFELAWLPTWAWAAELARVAVLPEDLPLRESLVPDLVDAPHQLVDAALEASRSHRPDLAPVLVAQQSGAVTDGHGTPLSDVEAAGILGALATESRGRLRALVAEIDEDADAGPATGSGTGGIPVGVVAWTLVADGWRALRPHHVDGELHLEIARVIPDGLGAELAPVLAEVRGGTP